MEERPQTRIKNFPPKMLDWVLITPLSSERLLQECEYMTNSPSLMISHLYLSIQVTSDNFC